MNLTNKHILLKYFGILLKSVMLILTFWFIYHRILDTQNLEEIMSYFSSIWANSNRQWMPLLACVLVFVNWSIEAIKWRYLILKIENISLWTSIKAVFSGVSISVFTPNRIGEYAGRVVYINQGDRIQAALITVISSFSQLVITLLVGGLMAVFYFKNYFYETVGQLGVYLGIQFYIVFAGLLLLVFLNTSVLTILLSRVNFLWSRFEKYISVFGYYSQWNLTVALGWSLLRYIVFSLQYLIILKFFGVQISILEAIVFIPVYFLTLTAIPTITLAELGVRELVSISIFSVITTNSIALVATSLFIWIINLAIPALLGTVFVLKAKIFKNE